MPSYTSTYNFLYVLDIRLNPALYLPCKDDIHEFCEKEFNKGHDDQSLHGAVIECLKLEYVKGPKSVSLLQNYYSVS